MGITRGVHGTLSWAVTPDLRDGLPGILYGRHIDRSEVTPARIGGVPDADYAPMRPAVGVAVVKAQRSCQDLRPGRDLIRLGIQGYCRGRTSMRPWGQNGS